MAYYNTNGRILKDISCNSTDTGEVGAKTVAGLILPENANSGRNPTVARASHRAGFILARRTVLGYTCAVRQHIYCFVTEETSMKRMISFLIALALFIPCCLADSTERDDYRFEGAGYDSPENAVLAYIEAMNDGNMGDMVSTFAVESFVDHCDPETVLERTRSFQYMMYNAVPAHSEAIRGLLVYRRAAEITEGFYRQYLYYTIGDPSAATILREPEDCARFLSQFADSKMTDLTGKVAFAGWVNPLCIDVFVRASCFINVARTYDVYGADDVACMIAHITIDGEDAVQFMDCIRYGDRWYNARAFGIPATILGLNTFTNGLCAPSLVQGENTELESVDLLSMMNAVPDAEAVFVQLVNSVSGLCGRRLPLTGIVEGLEGVRIAASAGEALSDADGLSLYAELHFMTYGGCVTIWVSHLLQTILQMKTAREKQYFVWMDKLGDFTLSDERLSLKTSGDALALRMEDMGVTLAFAK